MLSRDFRSFSIPDAVMHLDIGGSAEDEHLQREAGSEADEEAEVAALAQRRRPHLHRPPADLVQHEQHRRRRHVAVLRQDVAAALHLVLAELELGLHLVQDGGASRVHRPEHVVPVRRADALARLRQKLLDVLGDEARHVLHEVEDEARLREVAVDGAVALRQDGLAGPVHLEQRLLGVGLGVGAHDVDAGAVAEQGRAHEPVQVVLARGAVRDGRDLAAHCQHARALVVLRQVLGHAEDGRAAEAPGLVHHDALHAGLEAQQLGERVVGAGHVHAAGGGEHDVRDVGLPAAPLLDGLGGSLGGELGDLHDHDVVAHVERRLHVGADAGVGLEHLLRQEHMPLPNPRLVADALELGLERGFVGGVGDVEEEVGVVGLEELGGGHGGADAEDARRPFSAGLSPGQRRPHGRFSVRCHFSPDQISRTAQLLLCNIPVVDLFPL